MAGWMLRQSSDLWGHEEFGGSLGVIEQLEDVAAGEDVVFVWEGGSTMGTELRGHALHLAGPARPVGSRRPVGQHACWPSRTPSATGPLYLVADGDQPPPRAAGVLEEERRIVTELSEFEHGSRANRPRQARPVPVDLTVWRLVGDEP